MYCGEVVRANGGRSIHRLVLVWPAVPGYLYLDAVRVRVRSAGKVSGVPILTAVAVLADGRKELLALELRGREFGDAWRDFVKALKARGLRAPLLAVIDEQIIRRTLREVTSHRERAARILGISPRALHYKLKRYQIE